MFSRVGKSVVGCGARVERRTMAYLPGSEIESPRVHLGNLQRNEGMRKPAKRLGRGIGSGKGKTSGKGHKGQKARQGNKGLRGKGFEGGQSPFHMRIPKSGFTNNMFKDNFTRLNINQLVKYLKEERFAFQQGIYKEAFANKNTLENPINLKDMNDAGIVGPLRKSSTGIKLLANGKREAKNCPPIHIEVSKASKEAIKAIEKAGGTVVTKYYGTLPMRTLLKPEKFYGKEVPRESKPKPKKLKYYSDDENRGYLSPSVQMARQLRKLELEEKKQQASKDSSSQSAQNDEFVDSAQNDKSSD